MCLVGRYTLLSHWNENLNRAATVEYFVSWVIDLVRYCTTGVYPQLTLPWKKYAVSNWNWCTTELVTDGGRAHMLAGSCQWHWRWLQPAICEAHLRACQVQSGMSGLPVAVQAGASLLGRWLLPRVRQHSALSAVRWRSNLHGATNIRQLRRQNFCSRWTLLVELSS